MSSYSPKEKSTAGKAVKHTLRLAQMAAERTKPIRRARIWFNTKNANMSDEKTYTVIRQGLSKFGRIRRTVMGRNLTRQKADALKRKCERHFAGKGYTIIILDE